MYKLIALSTLLVMVMAAPKPSDIVYSSPILTPVSPQVVASVVSPAVTSYSAYSNSVVHGAPVVAVPVADVVPVLQETSYIQAFPYVYSEHVVVD